MTIFCILTLILVAYAALAGTEILASSMEQTEVKGNTSSHIGGSLGGFDSYETRIKNFIENVQQTYVKMGSENTKFTDELRKYGETLKLPTNKTRSFAVKYRSRCFCEARYWSPCPDRCMDSCYYYYSSSSGWVNQKNCSSVSDPCYCYEGSSKRCDNGNIDNCYQYKIVEKPIDQPCIEFAPDWGILATSYFRFSELITEPLKKTARDLESQSAHLKQVAGTYDSLDKLSLQTCDEQTKPPCLGEATAHKAKQLAYLKQLQLNMSMEIIKSQEKAQAVFKNVNDLKDRTLTQLHQSIKRYTCCMKGSNLNVTDEDCNQTPAVSEWTSDVITTVQSIRQPLTTKGDFRCSNIKWIPDSYVCDGEDDCGDDFDESNC